MLWELALHVNFSQPYPLCAKRQNDKQKSIAENSKKKKDKSGKFDSPIVTEITKASTFYSAEDYHQDFFENNKTYGYCRAVIWPKLAKLGMLKEE